MSRLFSPDDYSIVHIHNQLVRLGEIKSGTMTAAFGQVQLLEPKQISDLIDAAFWASLEFNEGRTTRFCLSFAPREYFRDAVAFATPVLLDESQIAKLAPAVPHGGCLLVSLRDDRFYLWGFGRSRPGSIIDTVTIDVWEPGTVRVGVGPFLNFAVLRGRSNAIIEGTRNNLPDYLRRILAKTLPVDDVLETQAVWRECIALSDLARMIVSEGHGGTILIVPSEIGEWSASLDPFAYRFETPDTTIPDAIRQQLDDGHAQGEVLQRVWATDIADDLKNLITSVTKSSSWDIGRSVRAVASLAAVDGAIVITRDIRVLGFGAKISVKNSLLPSVCMFRPVPGSQEIIESPIEDLGGTRHQSSAKFVNAHRDTVALVISQDRHMSVMQWDESFGALSVLRNAEWWV